ncbi:PREDICTED: pentatricopeptide repeat-containing protein At4g02750-like isoform X2 [Nelumbo nucifera]|uniref:Pentatricopeptide repeat-containing protein At4g02750-like isoform X2 n=1 Tax=Nelumbo nucifera TaxID=4432 RepID=A0A1U8B8D6_NELNU|nr:PREDICTED: pentatricopeptide repeat-containing protein At4g02750-like isoform X2 [Nelumbo nucifera]
MEVSPENDGGRCICPDAFIQSFSPFIQVFQKQNELFRWNARIQELGQLGRVDEARRIFDEMIQRDAVTWNCMITGYFNNGRINDARVLFDAFAGKNVKTWTAAVTGYAKNGRIEEARQLFDLMPERNIISWNAMISGYIHNQDVESARRLFDEMPKRNVVSWNTMITGYCHCSRMIEARELFNSMQERNLVSWMVMMSGYVHIDDYREAWDIFLNMQRGGLRPDQPIFVSVLSAAIGLNDLKLIQSLQTLAIKTNYEGDVVVGTSILNAYTRNGRLDYAANFFEWMPEQNEFSWTTMLAAFSQCGRLEDAIALYERMPDQSLASRTVMVTAYARNGRIHEARRLFDEIPNPNTITWNAMVSGYAQNGMLDEAKEMFLRIPARNSASWAAMISGFAQNGRSEEALKLLSELHGSGTVPSESSFTSALFACTTIGAVEIGRQIHSLIIKTGSQFNSYVGNGLISMYAKCKNMEDVSHIFNKMRVRDTISWNSLITGFAENYMLDEARSTFDRMPTRDVVSWTAIISAYVQAGQGDMAFELFIDMMSEGTKPNSSTLASLLSTCADLSTTKLGKQIHALVFKLGLDAELFVGNALITMYLKCGCIDGFSVFEEMIICDLVTWNAVLGGCAKNGFTRKAIEIFELMKAEGFVPDEVSFLGVLCACSYSGLVDEGWHYFNSMSQDYGLTPSLCHYSCMVDLLGRAGCLYEAEAFIECMPIEPDSVIWGALLGACKIHQNVELGRKVAERLFQLEPQNSSTYILLSNIYASLGMWTEVEEVRQLMKDRGITKEPGISWIQIKNKLHSFVTGDKTHDQIDDIYSTLKEFYERLKGMGYVPNTNFVLHDVEEEQKENVLLYHSEKLAIVFGLLNTPNGIPIHVMKNLRICVDCHTFTKFISKITQREIVIRDWSRFHHFQDGSCSCGDYW